MRKLHISNTPPQASKKGERRVFNHTAGWITIAGRRFYCRSKWEANFAAYLQQQKKEGRITEWQYESQEFWFLKIKRGVRSYKPDFKVTLPNNDFFFYEVKGFMDAKSRTKLKRMKVYHPNIIVKVIDADAYKEIEKLREFIPEWGALK